MTAQLARLLRNLAFVAQDAWIGILGLVLVSTVLMSILLASVLLMGIGGIVMAALATFGARHAARLERWRIETLLGGVIPPPPVAQLAPSTAWVQAAARDRVGWRIIAYGAVKIVQGPLAFAVVIVTWGVGIALTVLPSYYWALPKGGPDFGLLVADNPIEIGLTTIVGMGLLVAAPALTNTSGELGGRLAQRLLGDHPIIGMLTQQLGQAESARLAAVEAAMAERRRIERDLHDGAQQRLSSLAITLGMARHRIDEDPQSARRLVIEAHEEAKAAMAELRDIVRGIHSSVLGEQGLQAAISELADRCPLPVTVDLVVDQTWSHETQAGAYYIVAEAVTNAVRHAHASKVEITGRSNGRTVTISVTDDGAGGAQPRPRGGLEGLHDRARSLQGCLQVNSPPGGPTRVEVVLPCAS